MDGIGEPRDLRHAAVQVHRDAQHRPTRQLVEQVHPQYRVAPERARHRYAGPAQVREHRLLRATGFPADLAVEAGAPIEVVAQHTPTRPGIVRHGDRHPVRTGPHAPQHRQHTGRIHRDGQRGQLGVERERVDHEPQLGEVSDRSRVGPGGTAGRGTPTDPVAVRQEAGVAGEHPAQQQPVGSVVAPHGVAHDGTVGALVGDLPRGPGRPVPAQRDEPRPLGHRPAVEGFAQAREPAVQLCAGEQVGTVGRDADAGGRGLRRA
jgi:hypothetical protein